ncbi:aminotransferase class V-fold PLP-dependent enzyme [Pseudalkalibacillus decolorationis]|uniref:aminotransferase class V-fold PLP-dependent enzyme n=1 Tax=Pseudalkalibacillus decolorationis TaxID=163879 RepID=UPI00214808E4|nr:aminotransferase class V-fold PLP-dependent enzyme [Pseudalkalibacillus decolorationis]
MTVTEINIEKIRKDMPLHEKYAYLNTAAASAMPQPVVDVITDYLQKQASIGPYLPAFRKETYAKVELIREKAAAFIGATKEEVAFVPNGSMPINYVSGGLHWHKGDEVIVPDTEMLSNYVPWLALEKKGVKLNVLKTGTDCVIDVKELEKLITPNTRLITFAYMPNASGAFQPAKEICRLAKKHNVLTVVNANQTLGLVPMNVNDLDCDFLISCGRKWLRGPEGSGIIYVRQELIKDVTPIMIGWGGADWDFKKNEYSFPSTAKRFEPGCLVIPSILGLGAAIDYANEIGIESIYNRVKELTVYMVEHLKMVPGVTIYGPENIENRISITPFNVEGLSPDHITEYLEEHGIIIEAGTFMANTIMERYKINKMARFSPHYFNTEDEIDRAVALIKELGENGDAGK